MPELCPKHLGHTFLKAAAVGFLLLPQAAAAYDDVRLPAETVSPTIAHPVFAFTGPADNIPYLFDSETITLAVDKITFDMVLSNVSEADVQTLVAIPLPDLGTSSFNGDDMPGTDNLLNVTAAVDDKPVELSFEVHADAAHMDVTEDLNAANVPLSPMMAESSGALPPKDEALLEDWLRRGIVIPDLSTDTTYRAGWKMRSTAYFNLTLPAGKKVHLVIGRDAPAPWDEGISFLEEDKTSERLPNFQARYCLKEAAVKQAVKMQQDLSGEGPRSYNQTIGLPDLNTTEDFQPVHVVVEAPSENSLVSFCGENIKKTGPTRYEYTFDGRTSGEALPVYFLRGGGS